MEASILALALALLVLGVNCTTPQPSRTECTTPPIVANANSTHTGLVDGSIVTYSCYPGHQAIGSMQKTCINGIWTASGPDPVCEVIYCSRPPSVSRGTFRSLTGDRYTVGVIVTYTCYTGYLLNTSTAESTCQSNRSWTLPLPTCIRKDCGAPPNITGGNLTYTTTNYYSVATYRCRDGYDLLNNGFIQRIGRVTSRCLSSGNWNTPPICRPKDCGLPSNIRNGVRYTRGSHLYQQTATYECNRGYELHGNTTITCQATGRWTFLPQCKLVQCDPPPQVANATTTIINQAFYGNSTVYSCAKGFEMIGYPSVTCQDDGRWTTLPKCSLVNCRTPPAIHFGLHKWNTTTYNSVAQYFCDEGFKLIGVAKIYCHYDGRWTSAPTCELPPGQVYSGGSASAQRSAPPDSDGDSSTSALTGLAIACALFGVITLLCILLLIYKLFIAGKSDKLFSYASYKNGDDSINANI